ncbi:MAG: hypothetical protein ACREQA_14000, partial [Candidatus Binatia bacterium]
PSPSDNSSFTSYYIPNASADELKNLVENPGSIPCLTLGDPIELANGQDNSVMEKIKNAFNRNKKSMDLDNDPATPPVPAWPVIIPVVSTSFNPNQTSPIVAFVWLAITDVDHTGNPKTITGTFAGGDPTLGWCPPHLRR